MSKAVNITLAVLAFGALAFVLKSQFSPEALQRRVVKEALNDPESAQFRNEFKGIRGGNVWCGEVNARNRMGGFVGFTRYIAVIEKDRSMSFMDEVHFDQSSGDEAGFASKWRIFCKA